MRKAPPTLIIKSLTQNYPIGEHTNKNLPNSFLNFINDHYKIVHNDPDFFNLSFSRTQKMIKTFSLNDENFALKILSKNLSLPIF